jgi:hypothetical protein
MSDLPRIAVRIEREKALSGKKIRDQVMREIIVDGHDTRVLNAGALEREHEAPDSGNAENSLETRLITGNDYCFFGQPASSVVPTRYPLMPVLLLGIHVLSVQPAIARTALAPYNVNVQPRLFIVQPLRHAD